jgi:hypothetical protein
LNLHIFKSIFFKSAQSDVFKELWVPILKGLKHPNTVLLETISFKTLLGYATNVRLNKNKGLSLLTGNKYAQDRVRERKKFSPQIFQ